MAKLERVLSCFVVLIAAGAAMEDVDLTSICNSTVPLLQSIKGPPVVLLEDVIISNDIVDSRFNLAVVTNKTYPIDCTLSRQFTNYALIRMKINATVQLIETYCYGGKLRGNFTFNGLFYVHFIMSTSQNTILKPTLVQITDTGDWQHTGGWGGFGHNTNYIEEDFIPSIQNSINKHLESYTIDANLGKNFIHYLSLQLVASLYNYDANI